ncbi:MAG: mannose-6-phosphate isomerase, class I [Anaerolineae bacterium]|nr:mannose-6-phosphate isomerase, class I [Anaerolineae bacterium]
MAPFDPRPYPLVNRIQPYAWGARGEDAFIPRLLGIAAEADAPYAEPWMGAHPSAPSQAVADGTPVSLRQLIARRPREILGEAVAERFSGELPFLFKVLSTAEALSIQAHPTKEQARLLHARDPEHYPDDNHKPELAVALDSLTALVGFKPFPGILETLERYPEMAGFIGAEVVASARDARGASLQERSARLRALYATLVERSVAHADELVSATGRLAERLDARTAREEERLFLDMRRKYSGADAGLFTIFLLNLLHLKAGQGIFTKAGIPHAYLKGNIVECMANSDNVVRAGLTPKFKDIETLVDILTYEMAPPAIIEGDADAAEVVYRTPADEFQVSRLRMQPGQERAESTGGGPQILLVTAGEAIISWEEGNAAFRRGQSVLLPAFLSGFELKATTSSEIFRVQVPL